MTAPNTTPDPDSAQSLTAGGDAGTATADMDLSAPVYLRAPQQAQARLLIRLREVSDTVSRMRETGRLGGEFGHIPAQLWDDYVAETQDRADALAALGRDGGIAQEWLDYARGRETVPQRWPDTGADVRAGLIAKVRDQARELREIAAVDAAYQPQVAGESPRSREAYADVMAQRWNRIATVAALLEPVGAEREQIWPSGATAATHALVAQFREGDPAELARRWNTHRATVNADVAAHTALAEDGDLAWEPDTTIVPAPETIVAELAALPHAGRGAAIDADVGAALPDIPRELPAEVTLAREDVHRGRAHDIGSEP
ncbi:hypothetical protein [Nocardia nova]|uniref:hypothetical protein n=1 Tax=Nocardia nova TaxID=37330 RepID=UPI0033DF27CE